MLKKKAWPCGKENDALNLLMILGVFHEINKSNDKMY